MNHCEFGLKKSINTPWGLAIRDRLGYYRIGDYKNNTSKKLHRLIYENFWGVKLPDEIHIHHKDGNPSNNCILNLEAMTQSEHSSLHNSKRIVQLSTKLNISKQRNTTGYFRVSEIKDSRAKRKAYYRYRKYIGNGKSISVCANTIEELKQKVLDKGLEWRKLDG